MWLLFPEAFLTEIAEFLQVPSVELFVSPDCGAGKPGHRELIRAHLAAQVGSSHGSVEPLEKSQLQSNLTSSLAVASISHAPGLGGYALVRKSERTSRLQIGFDLEVVARVTEPIARRVCLTAAEFERAPNAAALWAAKEAAYKSLQGPAQPQTVAEVEITSWTTRSQFETFAFHTRQKSENLKYLGLCWQEDRHQFALAIVQSCES